MRRIYPGCVSGDFVPLVALGVFLLVWGSPSPVGHNPLFSAAGSFLVVAVWLSGNRIVSWAYLRGEGRMFRVLFFLFGGVLPEEEYLLTRIAFEIDVGEDERAWRWVEVWEASGRGGFARAWMYGRSAWRGGEGRRAVETFLQAVETVQGEDRVELLLEAAFVGLQSRVVVRGRTGGIVDWLGEVREVRRGRGVRAQYLVLLGEVVAQMVVAARGAPRNAGESLRGLEADLLRFGSPRASRLAAEVRVEELGCTWLGRPDAEVGAIAGVLARRFRLPGLRRRVGEVGRVWVGDSTFLERE